MIVQPTIIALGPRAGIGNLLTPGQALQTVVQGSGQSLFIQMGALRVPLDASAPFSTGQAVLVRLLEGGEGLQLRITPQGAPQGENAAPAPSALGELVGRLAQLLGNPQATGNALRLIPPQLPQTAGAVEAFLRIFFGGRSPGSDLEQVGASLAAARAEGVALGTVTEALLTLLGELGVLEGSALKQRLERMQGDRAFEARLAALLKAGGAGKLPGALLDTLRAQLAALRNETALLAYLKRHGRLRGFKEAVGRIGERLANGQLQNLRGLEQPYLYLDVPLLPQSGIHRARLHFFPEGGRGTKADKAAVTVVLDLSTTRLGDLWVNMRAMAGTCECRFRADSAEAVAAIKEMAGELTAQIEGAGYTQVHIDATLWEGDAIAETVALMRRFAGLNLNA